MHRLLRVPHCVCFYLQTFHMLAEQSPAQLASWIPMSNGHCLVFSKLCQTVIQAKGEAPTGPQCLQTGSRYVGGLQLGSFFS